MCDKPLGREKRVVGMRIGSRIRYETGPALSKDKREYIYFSIRHVVLSARGGDEP